MKKKVIAIPALLVIAAGMTYWFFGYEETLPEPSQETLDYITKEFNDLTSEELVENIQEQKKAFDSFVEMRNEEEVYNKRKTITPEDEEYKSEFSVLTPEGYKSEFNKIITNIEFVQNIKNGYSLIHFNHSKTPTKQQPKIKIKKIIYMDGSEEVINSNIDDELTLGHQRTVKSIDVNITYRYVSELASYHLTPDKPEIKQEQYTLKLAVRDENYLRYTLDGNLDIIGEDVTDKNGKYLSQLACSSGGMGYVDKMERFANGLIRASRDYNKNKDELIKRIAGYHERFEQETNEPATYISECTYYGTPEAITLYAANSWVREEKNITLTPLTTSLYPIVKNEQENTFYIIDQNGNEIINYGKEQLYEAGFGYFFTEHKKQGEDGNKYESTYYHLYKLDVENKKLNHVVIMNRIYRLSDDVFVISDGKGIEIFNINYPQPTVIPGDNLYINQPSERYGRFRLFYYDDNKGTNVINDKGEYIIPVAYYWIENGGENTVRVSNRSFMDGMAINDKKIYFINMNGTIRLTLKGYDKAGEIINGMIQVERDGLYGFTDLKGNDRIIPDYQEVRDFDNGYALVRKGKLWGVINKQGDVIIPFKYSRQTSSSSMNGLISYNIDGKYYTMQELFDANGVKTEKIIATEH